MSTSIHFSRAWPALCCAFLIASCGQSDQKRSTQVAATINGREITVHQINQALARTPSLSPEQAKSASSRLLEQLIDQQLLVEQSLEGKLDRDPQVVNAIDASRRQILAQAYIERSVIAYVPNPQREEIKKFYDEHPELFLQRRIYRFQQLITNPGRERAASLHAELEKSRDLNEIADWLRKNSIAFNANSVVQGAEQIPLDTLPRISKMKDGDITIIQNGSQLIVVQLVASQSSPLGEKEATPFIEQFLLTRKRGELATTEIQRLRRSAKLEYHGEFVKGAGVKDGAR